MRFLQKKLCFFRNFIVHLHPHPTGTKNTSFSDWVKQISDWVKQTFVFLPRNLQS
jgi:uncharacterized protein YqgV (UPF0045/DUF77 family)